MHRKQYPKGNACEHVLGPCCTHSAKFPTPISTTRQFSMPREGFVFAFVVCLVIIYLQIVRTELYGITCSQYRTIMPGFIVINFTIKLDDVPHYPSRHFQLSRQCCGVNGIFSILLSGIMTIIINFCLYPANGKTSRVSKTELASVLIP